MTGTFKIIYRLFILTTKMLQAKFVEKTETHILC